MEKVLSLYKIHPEFRFNKNRYNDQELAAMAYNLIKEGEAYEAQIGSFLLDWLSDSEYIAVKTSGSTGKPKKIRIKKEFMVNSALATGKFFELPERSTALHCLPANYIAGKMMLVRAMVLGWQIDTVPPKANALDQVYKIYDFCAMTPFQLDNSFSRLHLIRKLIVGGGAVSTSLQKRVQGIETKIYETYGMTETVTHIAARRVNPGKEKELPIPFKVLPDINISKDERDCLVIEAPKISEGIVVTNDVVELVKKKKFLLKGRYDNVINSGGVKLYPEQIETKLGEIIDHRFFVTSLPDDALGEKLVLMVESDFSEKELHSLERKIQDLESLDKYEIPKKIYFVGKFEETPNGKIHRGNTLRSRIS